MYKRQDFAFFAIAFNIKKMCAKMTKEGMDWLIRPFYELTICLLYTSSGHVEGSRAFARYRHIDDDMQRKLVDMIN